MPEYLNKYFGASRDNASARILSDVARTRDRMSSWRSKVVTWDSMVNRILRTQAIRGHTETGLPLLGSTEPITRARAATYVSNFVDTGTTALINRLDRAEPKIDIAILDKPKARGRVDSQVERLLHGILNQADRTTMREFQGISFKRRAYASMLRTGKAVGRMYLTKGKDGLVNVDWRLLEPYNCYYDIGPAPRCFVHEEKVPVEQAVMDLRRYAPDVADTIAGRWYDGKGQWLDEKKAISVIEYWLDTENENEEPETWRAVLVDNTLVHLKLTKLQHMPITIAAVNNISNLSNRDLQENVRQSGQDMMTLHAVPWFSTLEYTIPQYEEMKGLEIAALALASRPPVIIERPDGTQYVISAQELEALQTPGAVAEVAQGTIVKLLEHANAMVAQNTVIQSLERDMENTLPASARGQTPPAGTSGYLHKLVTDDAENATYQYAQGSSVFFTESFIEALSQAQQLGEGTIRVYGRSRKGKDLGQFHYSSINLKDIPPDVIPEVRVAPQLPKDDATNMTLATTLVQAGLESKATAMDKHLGIDDVWTELDRIEDDQADQDPMITGIRRLRRIWEESQDLDAQSAQFEASGDKARAAEFKRDAMYVRSMHARAEKLLFGGGNTQQPQQPNPPGVSPEVAPPEEVGDRGGLNPDVRAAAMGKLPYTGGRPPSRNGKSKQPAKR